MRKPLPCLVGVLVLVSASAALWTTLSLAQSKDTRTVVATYTHNVLRVAIPCDTLRTGAGILTIEVLDPEDRVVARVDRAVYASYRRGVWNQDLRFERQVPLDDLVWYRLRYRFAYGDENTGAVEAITSISEILRRPVVHIVGQQTYLSGGVAAVRLIVTEPDNRTPVTSGSLRVELPAPAQKAQVLYAGTLNERGTTQVRFRFPTGVVGRHALRYVLDTPLGPAEYSQDIQLEDKSSILLTTEKPVYQPGQTIHIRALALDRVDHKATAGRKLTFEVEDSRGNKVFRKITQTDEYGLSSADFELADEVNLGTYRLRAVMDENKAVVALRVEKYVLPRFKVAVDLGGKEARAKTGYRPGDQVTGTVRANYFFGRPVSGAEVTLRALGIDMAPFETGSSRGSTDGEGAFRFAFRIPDVFAGRALNQGAARLVIEAAVKDTAGHIESRGEPVTVSESPLLVTVVPESGLLVPGIENQLFVLTSYPDGTPAQTTIQVQAAGYQEQTARTDRGGIAIVPLRAGGDALLTVKARDDEGKHASVRVPLSSRPGSTQVLLRCDRAVYSAGERIRLRAYSTKRTGSLFIDVIKNRQTIGAYDRDLTNGYAELDVVATPEMTGAIEFNAYVVDGSAQPAADHRLIFVQPTDELRIQAASDQAVYKPGSEARIGFRVTNRRGEGVQAALGIEIVDQAVFALAEKQPGFAKVFFYLEQELMKPRYEIRSASLPEAISSAEPAQRDRAVQTLFAATELVGANTRRLEFGPDVPRNKYIEYAARYREQLRARIDQLADDPKGDPKACDQDMLATRVRKAQLLDAWGNSLRLPYAHPGIRLFAVKSAGPDGRFDTVDDLTIGRENRFCVQPGGLQSDGVSLRIDQNAGPRDAAEILGIVVDVTGAVIPSAAIQLINAATGEVHDLRSGPEGRFHRGLRPGRYELRAAMPGFRSAVRQFTLKQGDRAIVSIRLDIGALTETVEVTAAVPMLNTSSASTAQRGSSRRSRAAAPAEPQPETHVRSWFPESLYVAPKIITDHHGRASIVVPIADNITTWRMSMQASTQQGALGSGTSDLKVFQDFFAEFDLPVMLTQGDEVSLPVAVYNYSGSSGKVRLRLQDEDWFQLAGDLHDKSLAVENGRVGATQFSIQAKHIGKFKLTLQAALDGAAKRSDIVIREIEVVPNGREQTLAFNGRIEESIEHAVSFPPDALPGASSIFVRLYPGPLSHVVEGMDAILRMPLGCFEQTSSATYPNVLALDYMKRTKKLTPEVHAKASAFIAIGYQRLLTFEVPGGGFSWFGQAPANKILTAYGLMEFSDMSKVHDIDRRVIERTQQWLASQQQSDGSWKPDSGFINEGATNRYNTDVLRITAYIAWALETTGYAGAEVERARHFVNEPRSTKPDAYTLAVLANFAADYRKDREWTRRATQELLETRTERDDHLWWTAEETSVYGRGSSASVETTGLAVQALIKSGQAPAIVRKALNYLAAKKNASGTWGTTQATIMALRALLLSTSLGSADANGLVEISLNGKPSSKLELTADNNDLYHQFVLKGIDAGGPNGVAIRFKGNGSLAYQVAGRYFVPWTARPANDGLAIAVTYDRTRLAQDDIATATATIRSNSPQAVNMVMVDLGIPPGFDLLREDLDDCRGKRTGRRSGRLEKLTVTPNQAILYFDSIAPGETMKLRYRLRAKYPIRARTFPSRVYAYYNPELASTAEPVRLEIRKR